MRALPSGWAGPRKWKGLSLQVQQFCARINSSPLSDADPRLIAVRACLKLSAALEARVAEQMIPSGLGSTHACSASMAKYATGIGVGIARAIRQLHPGCRRLATIPLRGVQDGADQSIGKALKLCATSLVSKPIWRLLRCASHGGMPGSCMLARLDSASHELDQR